ncbi:MAG: hypothetical protein KGL16_02165 [Acidobacteriota bacterium]|nr:hypothetical protein [Acidobacteriota bacterium]
MSVRWSRLGPGDWLLGTGAVLLLIDLFVPAWFEYRPPFHATAAMLGQPVSANGWQTFEVLGPLTLVVCACAVAISCAVATRRSPALAVVMTTLLMPVAFVLAVLIAIRVLLDRPTVHLVQAGGANVIEARPGAYLGLGLSIVVFAGAFLALRRDAVAPQDAPAAIETVRIA